MKPIRLTAHAEVALASRNIELAWVERVARQPEWTEKDQSMSDAERRFAVIGENGGRILRVVCRETDMEINVITVFFDRNAARPE